ncbi:hydroxylamine oxidoreductase (HAO) [Desulforapulum autotrophicum HRM2]|uniref:Hydroxylamine oxidoreductase (HAO) n=1 Tax=Desulforapulum autotrophicum (strain ATCC 43914 / DSM 3382 / VKM B-1955 / HRM2) TaxID=177437 RepID=C0QE93_DESAH|nr:hydroxylamine oxidoreductase (HAO) [Desulforapulum autotrophicum HRM2]
MKKTVLLALLGCSIMTVSMLWLAEDNAFAEDLLKEKEFRIERSMPKEAMACIQCHKQENPGLFADWAHSRHASANITCYDCHKADERDPDVSQEHYKQYERSDRGVYGTKEYRAPVAAAVTPKDCSRCHPDEVKQYSLSKHANTLDLIWKIDPWLNSGMNSEVERNSGCYYCHGTVLAMKDGKIDPNTWPNTGVGRINMDGSKGSCTSCHTRHRFSVMEARKPEACGQCHLGPDHPQIEIYTESKHGDIYASFGDEFNFNAAPGTWTPGVDYRAPTCAACHMSGSGTVMTTHDTTERLSWELQAPLTVRPADFAAFPANNNWEVERNKMKAVCLQCHGNKWVDDHYTKLDNVVQEYNDVYYTPAKKMLDTLYEKDLITKERYFDEDPELEFYELWHYPGRRARMGTAMMAPDYAWWHGFYECKAIYNKFMENSNELIKHNKKAYKHTDYPNATGARKQGPVTQPK